MLTPMSNSNTTGAFEAATDPTESKGHGFGTMPVFLASISTILGAIMFLRFGYAVGSVGLIGTFGIILLGHAVTIPTALAIAEIATNRRVEGGGEYFIISRSFGTTIGGVIGISLFLSQAISVAFYMIAFAEAFRPLQPWFEAQTGVLFDPRMVSIPATLGLVTVVYFRGASSGVFALYVVVATLMASLALFFFGTPIEGFDPSTWSPTASSGMGDPFWVVFAICFPAFTGMTAGVGLSGDLKNPRVSIPRGTLAGAAVGMLAYIALVTKLSLSAPPDALVEDQLIMSQIAVWGPIIPIGLGAATLSSTIGSILVAPRTLQALAADGALPFDGWNKRFSTGFGATNEPRTATFATGVLAIVIAVLGDVNFVARLISMFFMVTYGSLCMISFLEHFAARPSYRPSFRSRWWLSAFGALACLLMMFQMDPVYAVLALGVITALYAWMSRRPGAHNDLAAMFEGVLTQLTRTLHIEIQRRRDEFSLSEWRPSIIMVDGRTFDRRSPILMLEWLTHRQGFGTYLHFIPGYLNADEYRESQDIKQRLVTSAVESKSNLYFDTIVSPSITSALAQSLQVPGVSGLSNNTTLFEFSVHDPSDTIDEAVSGCRFAANADMNLVVLRHCDLHFGDKRRIHVWLTWNDHNNANLMVLLSYILLGHEDWSDAEIEVFVAFPGGELERRRSEFDQLIAEGRLPVTDQALRYLEVNDLASFRALVPEMSGSADLTIFGFDMAGLAERGPDVFLNHPDLGDVLFVRAAERIAID